MFKYILRFFALLTLLLITYQELESASHKSTTVRGKRSPLPASSYNIVDDAAITKSNDNYVYPYRLIPSDDPPAFNLITYFKGLAAKFGDEDDGNKDNSPSRPYNSQSSTKSTNNGLSDSGKIGIIVGVLGVAVFSTATVAYMLRPVGAISLD